MRASASCHANNRTEQLFSGFSAVASCDCSPLTSDDQNHTHLSAKDSSDEEVKATDPPQHNEGVWSQKLVPLLFVGVAILVVTMAIVFGKLFVAS